MARIGRYDVIATLGRGAMGVVHEVQPVGSTERLALKQLLGSTPETVERFRREARILELLGQHAGIVKLRDVGEERGQPYIVMELFRGGTLEAALAKGSLAREDAVRLLVLIARAAHFAHEAGVIHRDLKPSNVLLDDEGRPHVTDFGIAKDRDARSLTESGTVLGTAEYMAPEQADGSRRSAPVDRRADVYSLGAILYRVLVGQPPFQGSGATILKKILLDAPTPPRSHDAALPEALEAVCLRALAKDPGDRQPTAEAFARELETVGAGESAAAPGSLRFVLAGLLAVACAGVAFGLGRRSARATVDEHAPTAEVGSARPFPERPVDGELELADRLEAAGDHARSAQALARAAELATAGAAELVERALDRDLLAVASSPGRSPGILVKAAAATLAGKPDAGSIRGARRRLYRARLLSPLLRFQPELDRLVELGRTGEPDVRRAARPWPDLTTSEDLAAAQETLAGHVSSDPKLPLSEATWPPEWRALLKIVLGRAEGGFNIYRYNAHDGLVDCLLWRPDEPIVWLEVGVAAAVRGAHDEARRCFTFGATLREDSTEFWFHLGVMEQLRCRFPAAAEAQRQNVAVARKLGMNWNPGAHALVRDLLAMGDREGAKRVLDEILASGVPENDYSLLRAQAEGR